VDLDQHDEPAQACVGVRDEHAVLATKDRVQFPNERVAWALIAFVSFMVVTTMFAIDRSESLTQLNKVFKIQLMTIVAMSVLHRREHLVAFLWVNVLSLGFYGFKGGIFTLLTGGSSRVWGPPGGFIEGNNELALALIMAIPLMYYLRLTTANPWIRRGLALLMVLTVASALGTQSRGAFLAIVAMGGFLWWRSPKKIQLLIPLVVVALGMLIFMPDSWHERMATISEYQDDGSAMGRIQTWWTMFHLANDRLLGGGFAIYSPEVFASYAPGEAKIRAAHSIYFQVLGEHGWLGLALFLLIWGFAWALAARVRRHASTAPKQLRSFSLLAGMCQVSLVGYAVGGAFLSLAYFDLPYNILVMLVVADRILRVALSDTEAQPATDLGAASDATLARGRALGYRRSQNQIQARARFRHGGVR